MKNRIHTDGAATNDLVSVVIPTFNRAYCLVHALDSALAQSHQSLEIIVVDDGSTDDTKKLVSDYASRDARVKYIYQENRGVSAARNRGLKAAGGDYAAFLDSDDIWKPWKLELQIACLKRLPHVGMVWTDMEAIDSQGNVFDNKYLRTMYHAYRWFPNDQLFSESYPLADIAPRLDDLVREGRVYAGDIFSAMIMGNLVHTSTVLIRRSRLDKVAGFNEDWLSGEDHDYHLRTCREGPVAFIDLAAIRYQRGMPDNLSRLKCTIAQNFLKTITAAIERDGDRIKLPRSMVNHALAEANAWVGERLLASGDSRQARAHLAKSVVCRIWQPRTMALLGLSCLPRRAGQAMRCAYRSLKNRMLGRNGEQPAS
jgi:glycosyltransferase involved in cell wall biosynthesis